MIRFSLTTEFWEFRNFPEVAVFCTQYKCEHIENEPNFRHHHANQKKSRHIAASTHTQKKIRKSQPARLQVQRHQYDHVRIHARTSSTASRPSFQDGCHGISLEQPVFCERSVLAGQTCVSIHRHAPNKLYPRPKLTLGSLPVARANHP